MKQALKIGFTLEKYPSGGTEVVIRHVTRYLKNAGHSIFIFVADFDKEALFTDFGHDINLVALPEGASLKRTKTASFIGEKLKQHQIDLFVSSGVSRFNFKEVKKIAPDTRLIFSHHSTPLWEVTIRTDQKPKNNSPLSLLSSFISRTSLYKRKLRWSYAMRYRRIYDICDGYTVLCKDYERETTAALGLDPDSTIKIYTQVNPAAIPEKVSLDKEKTILYLGRFTYSDKRVDRLIRIWNRIWKDHPDWNLKIVGDGREKSNLKTLAQQLKVGNLEFCDYTVDVAQYYDKASILCLVSEFEGWGLVLVEAQNQGVIPIAYACSSGVKEVLSPSGVNGVLVTPFCEDEYTTKLSNLMSNPGLRAEMQRNILAKNQENTPEKVGQRWEQMFYEIMER